MFGIAFIEEPDQVYMVFFLFGFFKVLTLWHKWKAHAGESTDDSNVLFTVKQSHPLQIKKAINVFLTNNSKKKEPDFHISGSYTSLSFKVYEGRRLIAEVPMDNLYAYITNFYNNLPCGFENGNNICFANVQHCRTSFSFRFFSIKKRV